MSPIKALAGIVGSRSLALSPQAQVICWIRTSLVAVRRLLWGYTFPDVARRNRLDPPGASTQSQRPVDIVVNIQIYIPFPCWATSDLGTLRFNPHPAFGPGATPNDFPDLAAVARRLLACAALYNDTAVPFYWRFTRHDLAARPDLPTPLLSSQATEDQRAA
jgi:hypothetical protein